MCFGSSNPSPPPPIPAIPAIPVSQPKLADASVQKAESDTKKKAMQFAFLRGGTLLTGASGLTTKANAQKKTLLGA